ncbi:D-2-hydroxyacid dehydrogenase [Pseudoneobacillus rhizosphaerae]|uniref:Glyoxylate/hydroxypyruvate reductase A n=1 Tax=Pseudoneobacillus rhizosphaerae TaxID=2880968 RepID=A0A9C7G880_9BACI|nr:D-2-hydroxyacid dehydrogenase [Pseudoneobacillus rhizosphaerae]CAG9607556.1 Glyoxylate/hydroxypyruvate reductase A [Pseudoneobacillus rhizosphaerae]
MQINNILIVSPMFMELQLLIEKEQIEKNFRYLPEAELTFTDLEWADALVCFNLSSNIDYSQVKWVHSLGAGVDKFLYGKSWDEDVLLTRTVCSFGQRIAEYCLSYILKDLQFHDQFSVAKSNKSWNPITPMLLSNQKVMIYGTGEIGQTVARIFSALGVEVYGVSLSGKDKDYFNEVMTIETHFSRLSEMNYLINTLPLTEQTASLLNEKIFERLSNVGLINVGRGASLDETAMLNALNNQHIRFAVLDVFSKEPLPVENPVWDHPNVHITPHISAVTTPDEAVACFIETLNKIEGNKQILNKVDVKKGY